MPEEVFVDFKDDIVPLDPEFEKDKVLTEEDLEEEED